MQAGGVKQWVIYEGKFKKPLREHMVGRPHEKPASRVKGKLVFQNTLYVYLDPPSPFLFNFFLYWLGFPCSLSSRNDMTLTHDAVVRHLKGTKVTCCTFHADTSTMLLQTWSSHRCTIRYRPQRIWSGQTFWRGLPGCSHVKVRVTM